MEGSAPQIDKWTASRNADGTVNVVTTWATRTAAGKFVYNTVQTNQDPTAFDAYADAKANYDYVSEVFGDAPYNLDMPAPPAGKLRYGFPEAAP